MRKQESHKFIRGSVNGKEVGDRLVAEQIACECRKMKGPVLVHKGTHKAQRYVLYGLPAEAVITKAWRLVEKSATND